MTIFITDPLAATEQLGAYTVSELWFGWGIHNHKTNEVVKITPYMTCRESLIYFLYNKLAGKSAYFINKNISKEELQNISYGNLVLMAKTKNKTGMLNFSVHYIRNNIKEIKLLHNDGTVAVFSLPETYYKFPFLTSYIALLIRTSGFFHYTVSVREMHALSKHLSFSEAVKMNALNYDSITHIVNNIEHIDEQKNKDTIFRMMNRHGDSVVAARCGINGIFDGNEVGAMYKEFIFRSIKSYIK